MTYRASTPFPCTICGKKSVARRLCKNCYYKAKRNGSIDQYAPLGPRDVFWDRVKKTSGCWEWMGTINDSGYGIFLLPGETPVRAHRYAYELTCGPIEEGKILLHSCDNPPCVNPAHLRQGTRADNARDCVERGRRPSGADHWNYRLTEQQVEEIKTSTETQAAIAARLGINQSTVNRIKSGKRRA